MSKEMKEKLLDAGAQIAYKIGVVNITRRAVAAKAKVSEALVSHHLGNREALHKALKRYMKKNGYAEPSAEIIAREGKKLRAKKTPAPPRKYSAKEVKAIREKGVPKKGEKTAPRARKTAARMPKLPPPLPVIFPLPLPLPLPRIEDVLEKK
jgi:AcrR family transcriptional regulator